MKFNVITSLLLVATTVSFPQHQIPLGYNQELRLIRTSDEVDPIWMSEDETMDLIKNNV
ncbi:hypothetical protein HDU92_008681, partial [Lobulomyces angularis]